MRATACIFSIARGCAVPLLLCVLVDPVPHIQHTGKTVIKTPFPHLYEDWKAATIGPSASDAELRAEAERERGRVQQLKDPFTRLARLTCEQRAALNPPERVVWEDRGNVEDKGKLMALVDFADRGSTLLVVPKGHVNFPVDLSPPQLAHLSRVAAATCDALVLAAGEQVSSSRPSCRMYVNPPAALTVSQMHVHVEARTSASVPVDDAFLRRTTAHLRKLVGGGGCF